MKVILESRIEFDSVSELFAWRAKYAPGMFLTGKDGIYRLIPSSTASKAASSRTSKPFLAQKSL